MKTLVLFALCIFSAAISFAQSGTGTVQLRLYNEKKMPFEGATAELLRSKDSSLVKTALSDSTGTITFQNIPLGSYLVRLSAVGNTTQHLPVFQLDGQQPVVNLGAATLVAKEATQMQGVTVSAKKPFIQKLNDRIVVNVESSIVGAGSSAMDVLELSPSVTVDQNDVISLRGRAGVIIMIDGKPTPMSGAELANYLKGLPSNAIERIDLITNPSAKYDAAGNSGIIDIRLKKDQRFGTNGTVNGGFGQGRYPKANAGASLNYRNKKWNFFGNYNFNYRKSFNHLIINRNFFKNGTFTGADDKDNYASFPVQSHTARAGADFSPSKNTVIGFVINSNFTSIDRNGNITTNVKDVTGNSKFNFKSLATNDDDFNNTVVNLNVKHKLDSLGKELTADVDYGVYHSSSITRTSSFFFNNNGTKRQDDATLDGDQQGRLTLQTAKVDFTNPLNKTTKLELGAKTSYVSSDNNAQFFNVLPGGPVVDAGKTNRFFYQEYNNAGYINFSKEYKKWNVQLGLRGEHTALKTRQEKGDVRFSNDYFQLFPSGFFNYKLKEDKTIGASVSRRIDRPGYSQLNPFLFQIDATIYATGNPLLRPQTTWSYELSYTAKGTNLTLGYSRTTNPQNSVLARILDVIPNFPIAPTEDSNITVQIPVNLQSTDYFGLTATIPVRITKWWNMMNNVNVFYNHFNGNIGGSQLANGNPAANIRTTNNFTLKKGWSAELNANLNTGGRYGYMVIRTNWAMAVGVQKAIMKGQGTIRLNATDVFWTSLPRATVTYEGAYIENWRAYRETRVANLSFTYRFGNNKVQAARRRATASEEERQRAGGN
jgi:iron complex outermembrane recepter protein